MTDVKKQLFNKRNLPVLIICGLILIMAGIGVVSEHNRSRTPSTEKVFITDVYSAPEGRATVISNGIISSMYALWRNGTAYLPVDIVINELNGRFYWDSTEQVLSYATPTEIFHARGDARYEDELVFVIEEDTTWVNLSYVAAYTNIQVDTYANPNRVFIRSYWGETTTAEADKRGAAIRTEESVKSPVVATKKEGEPVTVLRKDSDWAFVYSPDGISGYTRMSELKNVETVADEGPVAPPEYTNKVMPEPVCLVWHAVYRESGVGAIEGLLNNTQGINVVAPAWFTVADIDGNLDSFANEDYVSLVHSRGIQIWGMVENINTDRNVDMKMLLSRTSSREKLVNNIINLSLHYGLDGVNVDFEGLGSKAGSGYVQFLRELSARCRTAGLYLSIDNYVPSQWTEFYNRKEQGIIADYVIVMGYDEHYTGTDPGSTASLPFVRRGIEDTLKDVPAEKLINAVPFYTRLWTTSNGNVTSSILTMQDAAQFLINHNLVTTWREEEAQNYAEMVENGVEYQVWMEDAASLKARLELMKNEGIKGIAAWRLGRETPDVWPLIAEYNAQNR